MAELRLTFNELARDLFQPGNGYVALEVVHPPTVDAGTDPERRFRGLARALRENGQSQRFAYYEREFSARKRPPLGVTPPAVSVAVCNRLRSLRGRPVFVQSAQAYGAVVSARTNALAPVAEVRLFSGSAKRALPTSLGASARSLSGYTGVPTTLSCFSHEIEEISGFAEAERCPEFRTDREEDSNAPEWRKEWHCLFSYAPGVGSRMKQRHGVIRPGDQDFGVGQEGLLVRLLDGTEDPCLQFSIPRWDIRIFRDAAGPVLSDGHLLTPIQKKPRARRENEAVLVDDPGDHSSLETMPEILRVVAGATRREIEAALQPLGNVRFMAMSDGVATVRWRDTPQFGVSPQEKTYKIPYRREVDVDQNGTPLFIVSLQGLPWDEIQRQCNQQRQVDFIVRQGDDQATVWWNEFGPGGEVRSKRSFQVRIGRRVTPWTTIDHLEAMERGTRARVEAAFQGENPFTSQQRVEERENWLLTRSKRGAAKPKPPPPPPPPPPGPRIIQGQVARRFFQ